jgi:hypothetical protein
MHDGIYRDETVESRRPGHKTRRDRDVLKVRLETVSIRRICSIETATIDHCQDRDNY